MENVRFALSFAGLLLICSFAMSCGSGSPGAGQLQSIAVRPASADAENYPDGQVPFLATGVYVNPAHTVTPQPARWGVCQQNQATSAVSVTSAGMAQCMSGAAGTYTVFAYDMTNCDAITSCGGGCTVVGTAQLTCP